MRFLYSVLLYLSIPFLLLRLLYRAKQAPAYRQRWRERFGFVHSLQAQAPLVWVHAVSVGETLAAIPMIKTLQHKHPHLSFMITTTTPTGSERVTAAFGDRVYHTYMPYDLPDVMGRFLCRVNPCLLIVMETELWPNTLAVCRRRAIPVVLANARMSEKSFRGYARFAALTRSMLKQLNVVAAQHHSDADRFISLGLPKANSQVTGSIKFDLNVSERQKQTAARLKHHWSDNGRRLVWLVASTHSGEDEAVLTAFAQVCQQLDNPLLVIVPRHPERFSEVFELCRGLGYGVQRHSESNNISTNIHIVLGDTMGELMLFFGACDIAFVGGSLISHGGHNLIEPAVWGVPILTGPSLFNFVEVSRLLMDVDALTIVRNDCELAAAVVALGQDEYQRKVQGLAGRSVAEANRGALEKLVVLIERYL